MRQTLLIFAVLFSSCGDGKVDYFNPKDAAQIEGAWTRTNGGPYTALWFSNGRAVSEVLFGASPVTKKEYTYHTRQDTLFLMEYPAGHETTWICRFDDINTANLWPVDTPALGLRLKRM